jgi:hypothetical protein
LLGDRAQLALGFFDAHTRLQPSDGKGVIAANLSRQLALTDRQRGPGLEFASGILKIRPHHADDGMRHAAE